MLVDMTAKQIAGYLMAAREPLGISFNDAYNKPTYGITKAEFDAIDRAMHAEYGMFPVRTVAGVRKALRQHGPSASRHATKKKTKASTVGARYPFGGSEYSELRDPSARVVYRVINPSTGITDEFNNKREALEQAGERSLKERGEVAVEQGTMTSAGVFRYDLKPQVIWRSEWRSEAKPSRYRATKKTTPEPCVDVHFRVFPDGDVIALFPNDRVGRGQINSYQRLGQHGGASPALIEELRKASRAEYAPLLAELKNIGYCLRVRA
jgi:hypothetical protein